MLNAVLKSSRLAAIAGSPSARRFSSKRGKTWCALRSCSSWTLRAWVRRIEGCVAKTLTKPMNGFVNFGFFLAEAKRRRRSVCDSIAGASASSSDAPSATWEMNVSTKADMVEDNWKTSGGFGNGRVSEKGRDSLMFYYITCTYGV